MRNLKCGDAIFQITKSGNKKPYINYRLEIIDIFGKRVSWFMSLKELFTHIRKLREVFSSYREMN